MTEQEKQELKQEIITQIKSESQDVTELVRIQRENDPRGDRDKIQDKEHCRRDEYVPLLILGNCIYDLGYQKRRGAVPNGHQD